jgi:hypothetical protein
MRRPRLSTAWWKIRGAPRSCAYAKAARSGSGPARQARLVASSTRKAPSIVARRITSPGAAVNMSELSAINGPLAVSDRTLVSWSIVFKTERLDIAQSSAGFAWLQPRERDLRESPRVMACAACTEGGDETSAELALCAFEQPGPCDSDYAASQLSARAGTLPTSAPPCRHAGWTSARRWSSIGRSPLQSHIRSIT